MRDAGDPNGVAPETQLVFLARVLDIAEIEYWIDSGSLLGLSREGHLFPWDRDIDIGMWHSDLAKLPRVEAHLRRAGYHVVRWSWQGLVFKVRAFPPRYRSNRIRERILKRQLVRMRILDLDVFRQQEDIAWCPDPMLRPEFGALTRLTISGLTNMVLRKIDLTSSFWRRMLTVNTWWIPKVIFADTYRHKRLDVPLPVRWREYLALRYGDWETPRREWSYQQEDKALRHKTPDQLLASKNLP